MSLMQTTSSTLLYDIINTVLTVQAAILAQAFNYPLEVGNEISISEISSDF
jgi:hypothetical protein